MKQLKYIFFIFFGLYGIFGFCLSQVNATVTQEFQIHGSIGGSEETIDKNTPESTTPSLGKPKQTQIQLKKWPNLGSSIDWLIISICGLILLSILFLFFGVLRKNHKDKSEDETKIV